MLTVYSTATRILNIYIYIPFSGASQGLIVCSGKWAKNGMPCAPVGQPVHRQHALIGRHDPCCSVCESTVRRCAPADRWMPTGAGCCSPASRRWTQLDAS